MKISIITATYNRADTIRDTIESILGQTHLDWEHIIIDGASTDNTLQIIDEYQEKYNGRLKLISEKDKGIYDAMNKGIEMATGDYIGFLNSDDFYFDQNVLSRINDALIKHPTDALYAGTVEISAKNKENVLWEYKGSPYPKGGFSTGWHPSHPTFYARRTCYQKYGYFDMSFGTASDMEIMIRFIERYHISHQYLPIIINKMRFGGASNRSLKSLLQSNQMVLHAFDKNGLPRPKFYFIKKMKPKVIGFLKQKFHLH